MIARPKKLTIAASADRTHDMRLQGDFFAFCNPQIVYHPNQNTISTYLIQDSTWRNELPERSEVTQFHRSWRPHIEIISELELTPLMNSAIADVDFI